LSTEYNFPLASAVEQQPHKMMNRANAICLLAAALGFSGCAGYIGIAVKKGQQSIDSRDLPLTCIVIETDGAALPLDVIVFENLDTHESVKATLTKTFDIDNSHPDMLTAMMFGYRYLSMPILHLKPGRYLVKSLEFVGPSPGLGISVCSFDLAQEHRYWFVVKPSCVNYVGGLVISADWNLVFRPHAFNLRSADTTRFDFRVTIERDTARDMKWASDGVPGMRGLPSVVSAIEEQQEPKMGSRVPR
jgi:hypothetical protein